jgi:hypothetical protein
VSTVIEARDPAVETLDTYVARIVRTAHRPTPEQYTRLAALLGYTAGAPKAPPSQRIRASRAMPAESATTAERQPAGDVAHV